MSQNLNKKIQKNTAAPERFSASAVRLFPLCKKAKDKISAERFSLAYKIL